MPVFRSQRPWILALRTSHAARYAHAPLRSYSCSTRIGSPGRGGRVGWMRRRTWMLVFSSVEITKSLAVCQRAALPDALVQVQNPSRPFLKGRVARENPAPVTPRTDSIFGQPTPKCRLADGCDKPAAQDFSSEFGDAEAGQGKPGIARPFARQGFNGDDHAGGKSGRAVRLGTVLPVRRGVFRRSAWATWRRSVGACPKARGDLVIAQALRGVEDDLGAENISIR